MADLPWYAAVPIFFIKLCALVVSGETCGKKYHTKIRLFTKIQLITCMQCMDCAPFPTVFYPTSCTSKLAVL